MLELNFKALIKKFVCMKLNKIYAEIFHNIIVQDFNPSSSHFQYSSPLEPEKKPELVKLIRLHYGSPPFRNSDSEGSYVNPAESSYAPRPTPYARTFKYLSSLPSFSGPEWNVKCEMWDCTVSVRYGMK
jgi:hypothetical protein